MSTIGFMVRGRANLSSGGDEMPAEESTMKRTELITLACAFGSINIVVKNVSLARERGSAMARKLRG